MVKKREEKKEKEKKEKFVRSMSELNDVKRETLDNQDKILDLQQELELKKLETRHF